MKKIINQFVTKQYFMPSFIGIFFNPFYIIRSGLYKAINLLSENIKGDVLDFGCGSKPYESLFKNTTSYLGLDVPVSGHDHSSSKVDVYYDGKVIPFENQKFDSVVAFEVFEHVFNLQEMLFEINRVIKPNGHLLFTIPFAWEEHEEPYDFARYTSFGISDLLKKSGFEIIQLKKSNTYVLAIAQTFIAYLARFVFNKIRIPFLTTFIYIIIISPITIIAHILNFLLPKRYEYFSNIVVLAKKSK
jgi:SAM-dependent methyltransferase